MEPALVRRAPAGMASLLAWQGRMSTAGASLISLAVAVAIVSQLGVAHLLPDRHAKLPAARVAQVKPAVVQAAKVPLQVVETAPPAKAAAPQFVAQRNITSSTAIQAAPAAAEAVIAAPALEPLAIDPPHPVQTAAVPLAPTIVTTRPPPTKLKPEAKALPVSAANMLSGVRRLVAVSASPGFAKAIAAPPAKIPGRGSAVAAPGAPIIPPTEKRQAIANVPAPIKQPLPMHTDLIAPGQATPQPPSSADPKRQAALR